MDQFKGLKVLELASVLAGPAVGQFFAELGADVIKVENALTGGDVTRSWKTAAEQPGDRSAYFCAVNWGKRSVAVDLTTAEGKEIVRRLLATADVVIASYKPGDAEKLGVDFNSAKKMNPQIIYGEISGYGPDDARVGYDAIIQAEAGFMFMNGEEDGPSLKIPVALMDILAGHHLKEDLLLALLEKYRTGKGGLVHVSLIDAAISSLANQASNFLTASHLPMKQGSKHPNIAPYGEVFRTADGKEFLLAVGNDKQFFDLCDILGLSALRNDERFSNNPSRVRNRSALAGMLKEKISGFISETLLKEVNARKIPAGLIQRMDEVFRMPQARALVLEQEGLRAVRTFAARGHRRMLSAPPHLGQHTEEITRAIGLG